VAAPAAPVGAGEPVNAPLSGNIWKIHVSAWQQVNEGDVLLILEAMKMETQIVASKSGVVASLSVKEGDTVKVGDQLVTIA
jgi:oxaloacetate decarboxylase alpha subunit